MGWRESPDTAKKIMESIGDNFVAVTPSQLADLYRQYYSDEFNDITSAEFDCGMTRSEMGFLMKASDYNSIDRIAGYRFAENKQYFTYKFGIDQSVTQASFATQVRGNYQIEVSNDNLFWHVADKGYSDTVKNIVFNADKYVISDQPLYLRYGTRDLDDSSAVYCYNVAMSTNAMKRDIIKSGSYGDFLLHVDGGTMTDEGRKGDFVYRFSLADAITSGSTGSSSLFPPIKPIIGLL